MIRRGINPVALLVIAGLLFPGVSMQCKASCAMTSGRVVASPSDASQCCKTGQVSNETQSDGPQLSGSGSGCCTVRTHIPSILTIALSEASIDSTGYVSNTVVPVTARTNPDAAALHSDLSPPRVYMPSVLDRTATLRI